MRHDTPSTDIYTLSLHDALPILILELLEVAEVQREASHGAVRDFPHGDRRSCEMFHKPTPRPNPRQRAHDAARRTRRDPRSEEHTSELQSLAYLVCRLLLEKKNK